VFVTETGGRLLADPVSRNFPVAGLALSEAGVAGLDGLVVDFIAMRSSSLDAVMKSKHLKHIRTWQGT
jgi:hypothetical protein